VEANGSNILSFGILCFWVARLIEFVRAPGTLNGEVAPETAPRLKASELTWLRKHQIEELGKLLDADVLGLHRMTAIKVLCQSGLQQHLDAVAHASQ